MQWSSNRSSIVKNSAVKPGEGKEIVTKVEVPQVIDPKEAELLSEEERRFAKNKLTFFAIITLLHALCKRYLWLF